MYSRTILNILILFLPLFSVAQQISYSEPLYNDNKDLNFDIIGKVKGNILIYKNVKWKYTITVYNPSMEFVENVDLDFIPGKAFNVDFITYSDFIYCIYQYHTKGMVHCMAVKLDVTGKKISEPIGLDSADVGVFGDTKIYSVINSDDKKFIMVFKMQKKKGDIIFNSVLMNNDLKEVKRNHIKFIFDQQKDEYSNFLLDNEGNLVFTKTEKSGSRNTIGDLYINYIEKQNAVADSFCSRPVFLQDNYIDGVNLKIDNFNKKYIITSLYYKTKRGNIDGFFSAIWDKAGDSATFSKFSHFNDSAKQVALTEGSVKTALNDFYIKNIIVKKDGGFLLFAEEYYTKINNNNTWNRFENYYGNAYMSPYDYYYSPYYSPFYRPFYRSNSENTRYCYNNILIVSFSKEGITEWARVVLKNQTADGDDNYLSYAQYNSGADIHFLFNQQQRKGLLLTDYLLNAGGELNQNPVVKAQDRGYEFMPQFGKQVGARQMIIPCSYRNQLIFAKIDF